VALHAEDCVHRSAPFRPPSVGRRGVRDYVVTAFAEEQGVADVRFSEPVVQGDRACVEYWVRLFDEDGEPATLAGCAMARFDADGLVAEARDYWDMTPGHREPPASASWRSVSP
jgi:hypothetical protein